MKQPPDTAFQTDLSVRFDLIMFTSNAWVGDGTHLFGNYLGGCEAAWLQRSPPSSEAFCDMSDKTS